MRKKLIAGNWKLNKNQAETEALAKELLDAVNQENLLQNSEAIIIPTFTSLQRAEQTIKGSKIELGAQDLSQFASGAYTGEISADMLKEIGVKSVLVGHSERREHFKEDDEIIAAKSKTAVEAELLLILCCGESLETREAGKTDEWVCGQITSALTQFQNLDKAAEKIVIAYEPIWAIGTGKVCESEEANRVISVIRNKVKEILGEQTSKEIRILYGGSVKAANADEILSQSDIDGALVGGASLKKDEFVKIMQIADAKAQVAC